MLDFEKLIDPYREVWWFQSDDGHIVWRRGSGDNVELLHLRSLRPGGGLRLLKEMLRRLRARPPYATVFGFTRTCNHQAEQFYEDCGFTLTEVTGVYDDGAATIFSARYDDLCRRHLT